MSASKVCDGDRRLRRRRGGNVDGLLGGIAVAESSDDDSDKRAADCDHDACDDHELVFGDDNDAHLDGGDDANDDGLQGQPEDCNNNDDDSNLGSSADHDPNDQELAVDEDVVTDADNNDNDDEAENGVKFWREFEERARKRGVVYFSRIPPFMNPNMMRRRFEQFGEIGRIYLTPEDASVARCRRKFKKNSRKMFVDGWMEFARKSIARRVADSLNNTPIGGKKRSHYRDDIWNIRYLKGFKWHHLTEKQAMENAVRRKKIAAEVSASRKQHDFVAEKHQQSKVLDHIGQRQRKKRSRDGDHNDPEVFRTFRQKPAVIAPPSTHDDK